MTDHTISSGGGQSPLSVRSPLQTYRKPSCVVYCVCYAMFGAVVGKNRRRHSKTLKVDPALLEFGAASSTFAERRAKHDAGISPPPTCEGQTSRSRHESCHPVAQRQLSVSAAILSSCDSERVLAFELSPTCYLQSIAPGFEWLPCAASLYSCPFPL